MAEEHDPNSTNRLEAFSDGVFAIAITLLALDIRLPTNLNSDQTGALLPGLLHLWSVYLAYVTSFLSICVMWVGHHDLFRVIRRTDRGLLLINALLLMVVTFVNFPTGVIAEYIQKPDAQIAALLYSGTLFMVGLSVQRGVVVCRRASRAAQADL